MKIGLDFDGVISDCLEIKSRLAYELYDVSILPQDFKKEIIVGKNILTLEQYRNVQKTVYQTMEIGLSMKEVPNALQSIRDLQNKHEVVIITSRSEEGVMVAKKWLANLNIDIPTISVGYGNDKIVARDCDVYIDDDLEKLLPLVGYVPNLYLYSWPYNQNDTHPNVTRVNSWIDFVEKINEKTRSLRVKQ